VAEAKPASDAKLFYGSAASRRRVRSMAVIALLLHASLGD
jgi:hypothetical protein